MSDYDKHVDRIFSYALTLSPAEREEYLNNACAGEAELRARVDKLLRLADTPDNIFARGGRAVRSIASELTGNSDPMKEGDLLGKYQILRLLGKGGMGYVYLARRGDDMFEQQVAIKVISGSLISTSAARRFERERKILARLGHPGIASIYDGGVSTDGVPYFVMEYVDGLPVTRYANEKHLGIEARLRLFVDICDAVQHAHTNLIVHRDIKPSNIVVTPDGFPKLLDFGIATILDDSDGNSDGLHTLTGQRWHTPQYASPEQVRQEPLTTASDVYSLGVLLYELLTGVRPFGNDSDPAYIIEKSICETEPDVPSSAVRKLLGSPSTLTASDSADNKSTELTSSAPQTWVKKLRGDLDLITLKALCKDPAGRYHSADALGADIKRFLAGHPIKAHRPSRLYRARKFVRRNKAIVGIAVILALMVVSYVATITVQTNRIRTEQARSEAIANYFISVLSTPDPTAGPAYDVTIVEALDSALVRANTEFVDDPYVRDGILWGIFSTYWRVSQKDEARIVADTLSRLRQDLFGPNSIEYLEIARYHAATLRNAGNPEAADSLYRLIEPAWKATYADSDADVAVLLNDRAMVLESLERFDEAEELYSEMLQLYDETGDRLEIQNLVVGHNNFASMLIAAGRLDKAEDHAITALKLARETWDTTHVNTAIPAIRLATVNASRGDHAEAARLYEQAVPLLLESYGPNNASYRSAVTSMASSYTALGRHKDAEQILAEIVDRASSESPLNHAIALQNLATNLSRQNRLEEANQLLVTAAELFESQLPATDYRRGLPHLTRSDNLLRLGAYPEAVRAAEKAEETLSVSLGSDHWITVLAGGRKAAALLNMNIPGAREDLELAVEKLQAEPAATTEYVVRLEKALQGH